MLYAENPNFTEATGVSTVVAYGEITTALAPLVFLPTLLSNQHNPEVRILRSGF
ncbi:hypothetical protein [Fischerella thermalis]|uniref:hypothetical protein n=1 Tax=Fischerella thermalis TaxID=372787 RepID=UPI00031F83C1|nr:hypothetical protein [Fischerella thermalis]